MTPASAPLVARGAEFGVAVEVLRGETGSSVAFVGAPGIGKSALVEAVSHELHEAGLTVRASRAAASEADLPFVGLHDLFDADLNDGVIGLPAPLQQALDVALLRTPAPDGPVDGLALNLAVLQVVEQLSSSRRLLLVLDDLQWLDVPTRDSLSFALRRVPRSRVSLLAATRSDSGSLDALAPGPTRLLPLGPLDAAAIAAVVAVHTGRRLSSRQVTDLHELSGGNPLLALELARAPGSTLGSVSEVPVPDRYRQLLAPRIAATSRGAREALLAAALLSRPSTAELARVGSEDGVVEAEAAGLIEIDRAQVRFTHPLLAAVCRDLSPAAERRAMHARLVSAAEDEIERARHLALAALAPDEDVAARVEAASRAAIDRAAMATAADLALLAANLTPAGRLDLMVSRTCEAAGLFRAAGDLVGAERALRPVPESVPPGPLRAQWLADLSQVLEQDVEEGSRLLDEALTQPGLDRGQQVGIQLQMSSIQISQGDLTGGSRLAHLVEDRASDSGRPDLVGTSQLIRACCELFLGTHRDPSSAWRHLEALAPTAPLSYDHPDLVRAWEASYREDHEEAARLLGQLMTKSERAGDLLLEAALGLHLAEVEIRRGQLDAAAALAERGHRVMADGRRDQFPLYVLAHALAWRGRLDDASSAASDALDMARRSQDVLFEVQARLVLGFVEVSAGRYEAAVGHLERLGELLDAMAWGHPGTFRWQADAVEAFLAVDRRGDAVRVTKQLRGQADSLDLPACRALASRCEGLVLADDGNLDEAEEKLLEAERGFASVDLPLETARTLLVRGVVLRRQRQKALARATLVSARELFAAHGAAAWVIRAERELERAAAVRAGTELTESERSVAQLAGSGATNREIALRLYLSEKTVEAMLTRVYRKLSVRSRTELAHHPALVPARSVEGQP